MIWPRFWACLEDGGMASVVVPQLVDAEVIGVNTWQQKGRRRRGTRVAGEPERKVQVLA